MSVEVARGVSFAPRGVKSLVHPSRGEGGTRRTANAQEVEGLSPTGGGRHGRGAKISPEVWPPLWLSSHYGKPSLRPLGRDGPVIVSSATRGVKSRVHPPCGEEGDRRTAHPAIRGSYPPAQTCCLSCGKAGSQNPSGVGGSRVCLLRGEGGERSGSLLLVAKEAPVGPPTPMRSRACCRLEAADPGGGLRF
jgi:hypothetical protein